MRFNSIFKKVNIRGHTTLLKKDKLKENGQAYELECQLETCS